MADFPTSIYAPRTKQNALGVVYDALKTRVGFVEDVTKLDAEVVSLETILGLSPQWTSVSVAERIKGIRSLSDANEGVITIKGANVGIGTTGPLAPLQIGSLTSGTGEATNHGTILLQENVTNIASNGGIEWKVSAAGNGYGSRIAVLNDTTGSMQFMRRYNSATWTTSMFLDGQNGNVGIGTPSPSAKVDILSDILRLRTAKTPASAGAAGNAGDICWDAGFIYVCIATNTWVRSVLATW